MGKARLAPIKTMTIPRLELTAATVSTRMGHLLKSELDENPSFTYHTDSTTENPADDASRGLGAQSLLDNKRWLNGPKFLLLTEHEWPEQPFSMGEVEKDDPEKAVAVFLRVRKILRERAQKRIKAYGREIQVLDRINEVEELHDRTKRKMIKTEIKKTSSIYCLDPYLDQGTLRVGGRLSRANLPPHSVHPIILPRENHVTALIIKEAHKILGHTGRGHVLSRLRERYWIISANAAVRHVLSKCVICRRSRGKPNQQKMADLPKERVTPAPPFTFTGVDYFGPYIIKTGRKEVKRYGALFTCLASRAVHIEIANSLETDSFIQALRRFIARRGPVRTIRSDNGTNFVGAQAELRQAIKEMDHGQIRDKLRKQEIDWIFNPPAASHMGGVWERQIQTTRKVLAGLLQEHGNRLDDESLRTLMCEVEAVINSRPLTFISNDIDDLEPLTPSHLLTTKSAVIVPPPGNFQKGAMNFLLINFE
ncbi:hypothetical protein QZH41_004213 [Actinostola sp. cb2023]|nr:hypothetical protein QZH41_004213 [Actinostola sp. cb2023]